MVRMCYHTAITAKREICDSSPCIRRFEIRREVPLDSRALAVHQFDLIQDRLKKQSLADSAATAWLQKYVVPAVAEYWERPRFREYATWSIVNLADSEDRQILDALRESIHGVADAIQQLATEPRIARHIEQLPSAVSAIVEEEIWIEGDESDTVRTSTTHPESIRVHPNLLKRFLRDGDFQLINSNDYFEPVQKFTQWGDKPVQRGELIVSVNPQFVPIGDMIVHTMLRRIELAEESIQSGHRIVLQAVSKADADLEALTTAVHTAMAAFTKLVVTIRPRFQHDPEAKLRQACVVLTQIYAAKNPAADCDWLGLPNDVVESGRQTIDMRLQSWSGIQMYLVIANALTTLEKLYQGQPDQNEIDEAVASCRLVIAEKSSQVWWEGKECRSGFSLCEFRALHLLAKRASGRRIIAETDVFSDVGSQSRFPTMISRLKKRLPETFAECIIHGGQKCTYRLDLPGDQVHVATK